MTPKGPKTDSFLPDLVKFPCSKLIIFRIFWTQKAFNIGRNPSGTLWGRFRTNVDNFQQFSNVSLKASTNFFADPKQSNFRFCFSLPSNKVGTLPHHFPEHNWQFSAIFKRKILLQSNFILPVKFQSIFLRDVNISSNLHISISKAIFAKPGIQIFCQFSASANFFAKRIFCIASSKIVRVQDLPIENRNFFAKGSPKPTNIHWSSSMIFCQFFRNFFARQFWFFFFYVGTQALQASKDLRISRHQNFKRYSAMEFSAFGASCFGALTQRSEFVSQICIQTSAIFKHKIFKPQALS